MAFNVTLNNSEGPIAERIVQREEETVGAVQELLRMAHVLVHGDSVTVVEIDE